MKMKKDKPYVIGISSPSGGGKTSVTKALKEKLFDSTAIYFDEFDDTTTHPEDLIAWVSRGGDYNEWKTPGIVSALESIIAKNESKYILYDAPLGRAHDESGRYIDFMVFIDTPLDVAMARRFLRDNLSEPSNDSECVLHNLKNELSGYLKEGRLPYLEMYKKVKPKSDILVDGCLSLDEISDLIIRNATENNASKRTASTRSA
jgi:uridine kinase